MKRILSVLVLLLSGMTVFAQNCYWVFFTDKNNTTFDPYSYFDAKAIERYQLNNLNLYDISNYPVNERYTDAVNALTEENVGVSRWLNAQAVMATEAEIEAVRRLPFVAGTQLIATEAMLAQVPVATESEDMEVFDATLKQVALMQGEKFQARNINGKGVRIAVFDGGFPDVDTHPAFKHLRDNHQIVKTWNFANKKEHVYGYNSHGRMVLSCIAGIMNDTVMLGLAPAAEFLLARTEVETEKKKEEVWWVQALEWADQNGAHIVSSSLGYGKDLHDLKDMDGKTSIVAKGAAMAASKGILVCTAMGNEGDDETWKMLITPADVEGVLSVGAVNSLDNLERYSSFGPTADGRLKPNVVACGNDMVAASKGNYHHYQGTSFATPMVSGFAACVKQMHPEYTATQLLEAIEKSGNHYPYYDYAFGYGVPQAGYFTDAPKHAPHTFDIAEDSTFVYFVPVDVSESHRVFYKVTNGDGTIDFYGSRDVNVKNVYDDNVISVLSMEKDVLEVGQTLHIWYEGQYGTYVVGKDKGVEYSSKQMSGCLSCSNEINRPARNIYKKKKDKYSVGIVLNASFMVPSMWSQTGNVHQTDRLSRSCSFSIVNHWQLAKVYGLGFRIGFGSSWYALWDFQSPDPSYTRPTYAYTPGFELKKHNLKTSQFDLELFQRFTLAKLSTTSLYLETGVFGDWITGSRLKTKTIVDGHIITDVEKKYFREGLNKLDCGVRLRIGFTNFFAIYGQYRITPILKNGVDLPKWEVGFQIFGHYVNRIKRYTQDLR
ncbi:MAG: S8 family serine peptidase [Bacteroidales bacterium]|nr:S8 family serine peptidase [Bacteroidales bacterium]